MAGVITALALTVVGCTKTSRRIRLLDVGPGRPPAALTIVAAQPQADHAEVAALVAGSARTDEHVEIVSSSGKVLSSAVAPPPPVMASPSPPPSLPANPTQFQVDAHQRQEQTFAAKLTAGPPRPGALARQPSFRVGRQPRRTPLIAGAHRERIRPATRHLGGNYLLHQPPAGRAQPRHPPRDGGLRCLRPPSGMRRSSSAASSGITVIFADFQGSLRAQEEWQADLLQAGAARAIVLVPAAEDELIQVTQQGLAGQVGPAPADVYFGLNQASLQPAARTVLRHVAAELTTIYPERCSHHPRLRRPARQRRPATLTFRPIGPWPSRRSW